MPIKPLHFIYGASFAAQFLLTKLLFLYTDSAWFGAFTLFLSLVVGTRICWFGVLGPAIALSMGGQKNLPGSLILLLLLPVLFMGIAAIGLNNLMGVPLSQHLLISGVLFACGFGLTSALIEIFNAQGRTRLTVFFMLLPAATQLIFAMGLGFIPLSPTQFALANGIIVLAISVTLFFVVERKASGSISLPDLLQNVRQKSRAMFLWVPANLVLRFADKWIVVLFLSLSDLAAFALFLLLSQGAMSAFASLLQRVMQPVLFGESEIGDKQRSVRDALGLLSVGAVILLLVSTIFGHVIIDFFATEFVSLSGFLPLLLIGATAGAATHILTQFFMATGRFSVVGISKYVEATTYFILLILLTQTFGIIGAFIAYFAASVIGLLVQLFALRSALGKPTSELEARAVK